VAISLGQLGRLAEIEKDYVTAVWLWAQALATFEELHSPNKDIVLGWFARLRQERGTVPGAAAGGGIGGIERVAGGEARCQRRVSRDGSF